MGAGLPGGVADPRPNAHEKETRMSGSTGTTPITTDATPSALPDPVPIAAATPAGPPAGAFLRHAKVVGLLTLVSRVFGLLREMASAHFLGTGLVASAFTVAFTVPNLFRKLFGEGALSAAFIPLYAKAVKDERAAPAGDATTAGDAKGGNATAADASTPAAALPGSANAFAAAGVNLLAALLLGITVVGEAGLLVAYLLLPDLRPDHLLTLRLTAIMLPYVLLICGTAFLSGVLQVHRRFAASAVAPVLLNVCHIGVLVIGATVLGLRASAGPTPADVAAQTTLTHWLAGFVLVAGLLQLGILLPDLRAVGFRFGLGFGFWTPMTRRMLRLTVPVALGAGVVQLSVLFDRGLSTLLMQGVDAAGRPVTEFNFLGHVLRYPLEAGAPARLALAQFMYLFPLGIFATALATAIFPSLSSDALERDRTQFRASIRQGIEAALWEGIPASVGLILVREPAARLLFQHGEMTPHDVELIAGSLVFYAAGIWAFSLLQIVSRAFYALHDTTTPLRMAVVNLVLNLAVEVPLLWWLGEAGMAVGTLVAFALQAVWMVWLLDRRVEGLDLGKLAPSVAKMLIATALMAAACWGVRKVPGYPAGEGRLAWAGQLCVLVGVGGAVYVVACRLLGVTVMDQLMPRRLRSRSR